VDAFDSAKFEVSSLTESDDLSGFSCAKSDLDDWLRDDALRFQQARIASTYLLRHEGILVGYVALLADTVELKTHELKKLRPLKFDDPKSIPAIKVGRLAVTTAVQRKGAGTYLMRFAAMTALELSDTVGCRLLTVDSKSDVDSISFYKKLGFVQNLLHGAAKKDAEVIVPTPEAERPSTAPRATISMRLDLRAVPAPPLIDGHIVL
jgi:GNAT superfamily N-acetyltransferase